MKGKLVFNSMLLLVIATMVLTACGPTAAPTKAPEPTAAPTKAPEPTAVPTEAPAAAEPTEFVFAHTGPIRTMDAPVTWYGSTHWLTNLLYECLIWRKTDGSGYVGQAAESWEALDDVTWRFHLRPGLTFHNGEPLDANAVKWNIDRVRTREDFMVMPQWAFVKEVKVVDDVTVDVITPKTHAYFEYDVSYNGCELLPPKYIEEVGEEEFAKKPVGSGPYKLTEFVASERYVFEAWDDYWGGRPEVDRVIYQVISEPASQIAALLAGQVDLVANVPLPDREKVCGTEGIQCLKNTSNRLHLLYLRTEIESGEMAKEYPDYQPATLDKRIRHAISYALDRNLLAEVQGSGYPTVVRVGRYYPEGFADKYAGPEVADEWYDPEKAKELIKEAGYDPDAGNKPKLYLDSPGFYFGNEKEVVEAIEVMLEDVGFDVELNILEKAAHFEQIVEPGTNRDVLQVTLGGGPSLVPLFYVCDWWEPTYHVCDPEWDKVSEKIYLTIDADERLKLWEEWWDYFLDYAHTVTLYEIDNTYAMSEDFEWTPRSDGWMTFRGLTPAK